MFRMDMMGDIQCSQGEDAGDGELPPARQFKFADHSEWVGECDQVQDNGDDADRGQEDRIIDPGMPFPRPLGIDRCPREYCCLTMVRECFIASQNT